MIYQSSRWTVCPLRLYRVVQTQRNSLFHANDISSTGSLGRTMGVPVHTFRLNSDAGYAVRDCHGERRKRTRKIYSKQRKKKTRKEDSPDPRIATALPPEGMAHCQRGTGPTPRALAAYRLAWQKSLVIWQKRRITWQKRPTKETYWSHTACPCSLQACMRLSSSSSVMLCMRLGFRV